MSKVKKIDLGKFDFNKWQKEITNEVINQETERIKRQHKIEQDRKHQLIWHDEAETTDVLQNRGIMLRWHDEDERHEYVWQRKIVKRKRAEMRKQPLHERGEDHENSK